PLTSQLCRFTTPVPHLAVYSGVAEPPGPAPGPAPGHAHASPSLPFLAHSPVCPSPISVALDSTSASGDGNPEARAPAAGPAPRSRVALSLRRLLRRSCAPSAMFASLSPKCQSAGGTSSRVQRVGPEQPGQAPPRRTGNFFQIKVDIPPECRIYPIESEDEDEEARAASRGVGAKEIICPWESLTPHNGAS
ncbi:regulator of G-protein signaling 9-like, partial [Betta splendens]|uniref:Regulator of G-protein signaling 9-like n=1 Tax=Betta splendens TaxID=158456 RepID=A0A9W2XEW3_BETSP